LTKEARNSRIFGSFPPLFTTFHCHGDTSKYLTSGEDRAQRRLRESGFEYGKTIGIQFHLEYSEKSIDLMLRNCGNIIEGRYVQEHDEIISRNNNVAETRNC